jgi:hypothetical protein
MRLFYDSMYVAWKREKTIWEIPCRTIDEYSYEVNRKKQCFIITKKKIETKNSKQKGFINSIRKFLTLLYTWDDTFRYTTVAVCTYTVAYLFLFHLTGTVILLYNTQKNSYIQYINAIFDVILDIGMF